MSFRRRSPRKFTVGFLGPPPRRLRSRRFLRRLRTGRLLRTEALVARPGLDQRPIDREVLLRQQILTPRLLEHCIEEPLRDLPFQQTVAVLRKRRGHPDRIVHPEAHEPTKQQVVFQLLHQLTLTADGVKNLQKQGTKEPLRGDRGPTRRRVQRFERRPHRLESRVDPFAHQPKRVIRRNPVLQPPVTEHRTLLTIVSAQASAPNHFLAAQASGERDSFSNLLSDAALRRFDDGPQPAGGARRAFPSV